jgi:hypothetical protein
LASKLTELRITVNKLSLLLSNLPFTLTKLPKIPFVRIFAEDFHHIAQSFSWSVIMIIGSFDISRWSNFGVRQSNIGARRRNFGVRWCNIGA